VRNPALTPLTNAGAGLDSPDDLAFEDWLARLDTLADAHQRLRSNQRCNRQPGRSEPSGERCSSMKVTISVAGVELPDEESCGRLQDRHVLPQPTVLRPQPADLLGAHMPHWLAELDVPLFVSHRRLAGRRTLPRARTGWALDSGGFTELSMFGGWRTAAEDYVAAVRRYATEIGNLEWAAPMDWRCEPVMLAKTGLDVPDHQRRTVFAGVR
jgi:hypothetical protein